MWLDPLGWDETGQKERRDQRDPADGRGERLLDFDGHEVVRVAARGAPYHARASTKPLR